MFCFVVLLVLKILTFCDVFKYRDYKSIIYFLITKILIAPVAPAIYKPSPTVKTKFNAAPSVTPDVEHAKKIAEEAVKKIMQQASKNKILPAKIAKPETKKSESFSRMSNLESFKEELKQ